MAENMTLATPADLDPAIIQEVLLGGDLAKLTPAQRLAYYKRVCESVGLNPLTQPFAYINLNGKLVLYALKAATDQLRALHRISVDIKTREVIDGVYVVTAGATKPDGRRDESTGAVPIEHVKGEARANAMLKAETKAKRRVTLSICGLGMLDETEVETIPGATPGHADIPISATAPLLDTATANAAAASMATPSEPTGFHLWWGAAEFIADNEGTEALAAHWKGTTKEIRTYVNATRNDKWEALKKDAATTSARGPLPLPVDQERDDTPVG